MSTCAPSGLQTAERPGPPLGRQREQQPTRARVPDAGSICRHREESGPVRAPRDRIRPEAARRMAPDHPEVTTGRHVEDADGGVLARRCDSRAVRTEDRAVDAAEARAKAVAPADDDQLPARLGVEDPCAAVRARGRDARAVRADVDPDHRADRSVRSRVLIEDESSLSGCGAPDAHRPFAPGGRDEPPAVRRECDVGVLVRLRPGQREYLAAAGGGDVPDPRSAGGRP